MLCEVQSVQIIEIVAIESAKQNQTALAEFDASESASGDRERSTQFDLFPTMPLQVKAVNIVHIVVVSSAEYEQHSVIEADAGMAPASRRSIHQTVEFGADNSCCVLRLLGFGQ